MHRLDELEFCSCHCPYHGEPNGCNRPEGECQAYRQYLELKDFEESDFAKSFAKDIIKAFDRKADEVRKEIAKEILLDVWDRLGDGADNDKIIRSLFARYGVEVDE